MEALFLFVCIVCRAIAGGLRWRVGQLQEAPARSARRWVGEKM